MKLLRFAHTCIRQIMYMAGCVVLSAACASQTSIKHALPGLGATGPGGGLVWYARDGVYIEAATLPGAAGFDEAKRLASAWRGGGLTDWRAATKGKLIMLSHYYKDSGGTVSGRFWSGSYDGTHETRFVWFVDLTSGTAYHNSAGGRQARHGVLAIRQWMQADARTGRTGTSGTAGGCDVFAGCVQVAVRRPAHKVVGRTVYRRGQGYPGATHQTCASMLVMLLFEHGTSKKAA